MKQSPTATRTAALALVALLGCALQGCRQIADLGDVQLADYPAAVLNDHPIAYYRLDDPGVEAADAIGNRHPGQYYGNPQHGVPGVIEGNSAVRFRKGQWVSVGLPTDETFAFIDTPAFTFEAWIMLDDNVDGLKGYPVICSKSLDNAGYVFSVELGVVLVERYVNGQTETVPQQGNDPAADTVPPDVFTHVAATFDKTQIRIYLNGTPVAEGPASGQLQTNGAVFAIGAIDGTSGYWSGVLDEVAVYDRALPAETIAAHYNVGKPR